MTRPRRASIGFPDTAETILAENGGDIHRAYRDVCRLYDESRRHISAGYARADTSKLEWNPKPPPDDKTSDEWIGTPGKPD